MKKILFLVTALFCFGIHAYEITFDGAQLKRDNGKVGIWPKNAQGKFGFFSVPSEDAELVSFELQNGELVIDTRAYYNKYKTGKTLLIGWYGIKPEELFRCPKEVKNPSKVNRFEVTGSATAGTAMDLVILSIKNSSFWVSKYLFTGKKNESFVHENMIPESVENICLRTDLKSPGIYRFKSIKFFSYEKRKENKPDASVNHIRNGGAENGFSNISTVSLDFARHTATGKFVNYFKVEIESQNEISIDDTDAHSGRYSYKLVKKADLSYGRLLFNPVPFLAGQPTSFTVWMKADRPMFVEMGFYLASGVAVAKGVQAGTKWKKYELYQPSWGSTGKDYQIFGNIVSGYPTPTGVAIPYLAPRDKEQGTLRIDTVSYAIGGHSTFRDDAPVHLRSSHERKSGYYFTGEPIKTVLETENYTEKPLTCTVSHILKDWTGKIVQESKPQSFVLNGAGKKKFDFSIVPPASLRGPMNLTFLCKTGDRTEESALYFGVIEKNRKPNSRAGIELASMQNIKLLMPYLKDFRIGTVRIGTASGDLWQSFDQLPYLKSQGIKPMLCVSMSERERDNPELWNAWIKKFETYVKKYAGLTDIYESQNEANISRWTIETNWKQIQDVARIVKQYDPQAKIAGPTTCTIDYTWIAAILTKGGKDLFDYVTYHPYRSEPELPDYTDEAIRLQKMIDTFRKIPQMGTEAGHVVPSALTDHKITDYVRDTAALDIRNIIQGFAGGVERYYHFCLNARGSGSEWQLLFTGNPDNNNTPVPNVMFFALRNLIDRLEEAPVSGRAKLGLNYRCHIFDHGKKRIAALWKWKGEASVMRFSKEASAKLDAYDFCGSKISTDSIRLYRHPIYLESSLSTAELASLIENASLTNSTGSCVEVEPSVMGSHTLGVNIRNITGRPFGCTVSILTPGVIEGSAVRKLDSIPGEDSGCATFQLKEPVTTASQKLKVLVEIPSRKEKRETEINLRGILVRKAATPIKIDGDLSDWPANAVKVHLDNRNSDPLEYKNWGSAEKKITTDLRYAWDDDYLYVSAEVFKPELYPLPDAGKADRVWQYDSVQVCFDPLRNAAPDKDGLDDDDFEYSIGIMGKDARVYRRWASSALYDSLNKEQGLLPVGGEVPVAIRKYADRTVYEIAFSRRSVSPFRLLPNSTMRMSTLVNVNNGKERAGFLELTPGIGHLKRPGLWMDLILLP